ncbi:MAG TPA: Rieske 2Fe-2S domain-containing protein [Acidimicrobiales bacterium]|jgi:nitrite reductase/ring-hydroxylating ferredoxin subunit/predicted secreted protein
MDDSFVAVLRGQDLPVGTEDDWGIRHARIGEATILLARLTGGEVVAFAATCPHQATGLELAKLWDGNVRCARHNYLYDPRTGENVQPTRDHPAENLWKLKPGYLPTYPVVEQDEWIYVGPCNPPPPTYDPALEVRPVEPDAPGDEEPEIDVPVAEAMTVRPGSTFELRLPMSPLPGYSWQVEVEGPLVVLGESEFDEIEPELCVRLSAGVSGTGIVRCGYSAPWEAEPSEFRHYEVEILEH